jgi:cytochrome c-type biogenesis protein CcmE
MNKKRLKFVVGSAVVLAAVVALGVSSMEETKAYYQTVPELRAMGSRAEGRRVRVAGNVVPGSIEHLGEGVVNFDIAYEGEELSVHYVGRGPLPDTLVDRAQAVAEGVLQPDGSFEATLVQAKCASKYEAAFAEGKTAIE